MCDFQDDEKYLIEDQKTSALESEPELNKSI